MSLENTIIFLILIIINILFYLGNNRIASFLNLMDIPDEERKIHTKSTSHWWFFFFNILTIFLLSNYFI